MDTQFFRETNNTAISAPWYGYQRKLNAIFVKDPKVEISDIYPVDGVDDYDYAIDVIVKDHDKFIALDRVLPGEVTFGNVKVAICLFDILNENQDPGAALFEEVFKGNPIVSSISDIKDLAGESHVYVAFEPEVIQFFNDDLSDLNRNWNGLAEDIAREIFDGNDRGVNFCTALKQTEAKAETINDISK